MRVLVTGAAGFIGGWTVKELRKKGFDVIGTDRVAGSSIISADITDLAQVLKVFSASRPDAVIHLAAISGSTGKNEVEQSLRQPHSNFLVNVLGTVNVCEACRLTGVKKLLYMSSFAVYGRTGKDRLPITEETPVALEHAYATSKFMGELAVKTYSGDFGIKSAIFRAPFIVGENQNEMNALKEFIHSALNDGELVVFGNGAHVREFIHPEDLVDAYTKAIDYLESSEKDCELFVLGNTPIKMNDLAEQIISLVGKGRIVYRGASDRAFDQYSDYSKARRLLGWNPKFGISAIVNRMVSADQAMLGG
jgi:UDP-glucose 4-epimerase